MMHKNRAGHRRLEEKRVEMAEFPFFCRSHLPALVHGATAARLGTLKRDENRRAFPEKARPFSGKFTGFNVIFPKISGYFFFGEGSMAIQPAPMVEFKRHYSGKYFKMSNLRQFQAQNPSRSVKACQSQSNRPRVEPTASAKLGCACSAFLFQSDCA